MIMCGLVRIGRDCELKYLPDGTAVANMSLAYNYGNKDADDKRPTQWIDAALWGKRAEGLAPYLLKGTQINVVMEDVHGESFERRDGGTGYSLRARIMSVDFASAPADQRGEPKPARQVEPKPDTKPAVDAQGKFLDPFEDDTIPF